MRPTDRLLVAIVSGEGAIIVALVGWTWRALAGQVKQTAKDLERLSNTLERHLAWHEGMDLYVTASTSTIAVAVTDAGGTSQTVATIPASTYAPVFVPSGSSWTLTYTTAPTALTAQGL